MQNQTTVSVERVVFAHVTHISALIGLIQALFVVPGLILNILIMMAIGFKGLLRSKNPVIYKLIFNLMISDTIQLCIGLVYSAPTSLLQDYLLPDSLLRLPSTAFLINWYMMWFMLATVAINRYMTMVWPSECVRWFSHEKITRFIGVSWLLTIPLVTLTQFILPCCRFTLSYQVYSYLYTGNGFNSADYFVELPGNIGTSLILMFCYIGVLSRIRGIVHGHTRRLGCDKEQQRKNQEARLSIQFFFISGMFIFTWIFFRLFPLVIPAGILEPFAIVQLMVTANSSLNAFFYLAYNETLRRKVCLLLVSDIPLNSQSGAGSGKYSISKHNSRNAPARTVCNYHEIIENAGVETAV